MVDYSAAISSVDSSDRAASKSLLSEGSPDDAARAFQLERGSGVPAQDISQDIPGFEQAHSAQLSKMLIDNNSDISNFIASHPLHGQLVKDDIANLDDYSRAYRRMAPGGHPFTQFLQGFQEQLQGPKEVKRRAAERWPESLKAWPTAASIATSTLGIPFEMGVIEPFLGLLEGSRKALKAFYINQGIGSEQDADRFANEFTEMLEYEVQKPSAKLELGRPRPQVPPEVAAAVQKEAGAIGPFVRAGERPPIGVSDIIDEIEAQHTELSSKATDEVIAARDKTALAQRSPEKLEEFTRSLPGGTTRIGLEAFEKVPPDKFDWIPDLESRLAQGPISITVPTNLYISKIEKEIHDEIKEFVAHGEDLSPAEVKELKENKVPTQGGDTLQTIRDSARFNPIVGFHGSQADFQKFSDEFIGTGQGAGTFGRGHYVAQESKVAEEYKLEGQRLEPEEIRVRDDLEKFKGDREAASKRLQDEINNLEGGADTGRSVVAAKIDMRKRALDLLKQGWEPPKGNLYQVKINADPEAFVDYDKPVEEQPQHIKDLIAKAPIESPEFAAAARAAGIPGIKYLDQGSRIFAGASQLEKELSELQASIAEVEKQTGSSQPERLAALRSDEERLQKDLDLARNPTRNFVVFDPSMIEITHKNGEPVKGKEELPPIPPEPPATPEEPPPQEPSQKRIFQKAKAFGRTEKEYSKYEQLIAQRDAEDVEWRLARAEKEANLANSQAWKDEARAIEPEIRDEISTRPEVAAYRFFQDGEAFGQKLKRRPKINQRDLTDEQRPAFPGRFLTDRGGYSPDAVANLFGYSSGDDLVSAISSLERQAETGRGDIVERLVQAEIARRVEAKLGDSFKDQLDEAKDHALSATQLEMIHEQMLQLGTQVGTSMPIPPMATKLGALNLLHQETYGAMSSRRYLSDAGRMGRRVEKNLLGGDPMEAFKAAQAQYIAAEMAKEARQVEKEANVFERLAKRYRKREVEGRDPETTNWIHNILNQIGEGTRAQADIDTEIGESAHKTFPSFLDSKAAMGREIYVAEHLLDPTYSKNLDDMSVLEARQTMATLRSLDKVSRDENRLEVAGQRQDREKVLSQMLDQLESLGPAAQFEGKPGVYNKLRNGMRTYLASTLQIESLLNRWDRADAFGVFNQWLGRPLIEAANSEAALQREVAADYKALPGHLDKADLAKPIPNTLFKDPLEAWQKDGTWDWDNATPIPLTRKELRAIMLNAGNPSNLSKLAKGYGLKPAQVLDWLNTYAKKEDWDWAQAHGDMFEKLKKQSDTMYRNLSGVAPESVEITGIQTPFGDYKGWYHPLIYDSIVNGAIDKAKAPSNLFETEYTRANTPASYTKARTGYVGPLSLSLDQVPARLTQEIHDISFHEPIVNASKIIYDPRFTNGVTKYYGNEYSQLFIPWLKDIANAKNYSGANQAALDRWAGYFRQNIIGTSVGLNPRTVEKHTLTALFNSIKEVGGQPFLDASMSLFNDTGRGESNWDFAMRSSEELQRRHQNFQEQVSGAQETALGENTIRQSILQLGTKPVAAFDLLSAVPTWLAGYKSALEEGRSAGDAVFAGDRAVRRAHGSTAITSRPGIMRYSPGIASLYNFMNRMAQYQYELGWQARDLLTGKAEGKEAEFSKNVMAGLFVNVLLVGLVDVAVSDITDKDSYASITGKSIATGVAAPWWLARDMMHAVIHKSDPMLGLGSTELKTVTDALRDINRKDWGVSKEHLGKTVKHVNNMLGAATGLTNAEIGNLAEFMIDLDSGKARPNNAPEWWNGLTKGEVRQKEPHPDLVERGLRVISGGQ